MQFQHFPPPGSPSWAAPRFRRPTVSFVAIAEGYRRQPVTLVLYSRWSAGPIRGSRSRLVEMQAARGLVQRMSPEVDRAIQVARECLQHARPRPRTGHAHVEGSGMLLAAEASAAFHHVVIDVEYIELVRARREAGDQFARQQKVQTPCDFPLHGERGVECLASRYDPVAARLARAGRSSCSAACCVDCCSGPTPTPMYASGLPTIRGRSGGPAGCGCRSPQSRCATAATARAPTVGPGYGPTAGHC